MKSYLEVRVEEFFRDLIYDENLRGDLKRDKFMVNVTFDFRDYLNQDSGEDMSLGSSGIGLAAMAKGRQRFPEELPGNIRVSITKTNNKEKPEEMEQEG